MESLETSLRRARVLPIVALEAAEDALDLAEALRRGGATAVEIVLRTPAALEAIRRIARAVPDLIVGAGTVLDPIDLARARDAGAAFAVSPGFAPALAAAAAVLSLPLLPGVATASEVMAARAHGFSSMKLFPAAAAGGPALLRALAGPFPEIGFCPTGGVTAAELPAYLAEPNVVCVGGSWLAPLEHVRARRWSEITRITRKALA